MMQSIRSLPETRKYRNTVMTLAASAVLCSTAIGQVDNFDSLYLDMPVMIDDELLRESQPLSDAAAYVTVITGEMINDFGYRTIGEMLSAQAGFTISDDGVRSYVGVRGLSSPGEFNSRVLFMVNGQRLNDGGLDSWFSGENNPIDIRSIERVEIIRGPGTSAYGPNAWLGVINVITKTGRARGGLDVYAGTDDGRRNLASIGYGDRLKNGLDFDVSLRMLRDDGPETVFVEAFDRPNTNNGIAENLLSKDGETALLTAAWEDFNFQHGFSKYELKSPVAPFFSDFNDDRVDYVDDVEFTMLQWRRVFSNGLDARVRIHQESTRTRITNSYASVLPFLPDPTQITDIKTRTRSMEFDLERTFGIHSLSTGIFVTRKSPLSGVTAVSGIPERASAASSRINSVYFNNESALSDATRIIIGMRVEKRKGEQSRLNPRVAWIQDLNDAMTLKIILGSASREPNWSENSYAFARPVEDFDLSEENINTTEIQLTPANGNQDWHISIYDYRFSDVITPGNDPAFRGPVYINAPQDQRHRGIEFDRRFQFEHFNLSGNLSYVQARTGFDNRRSLFAPRTTANLAISNLKLFNEWRLSAEARYRSSQLSYSGQEVPGALILFGSLHWQPRFIRNLDVSFRARNITDQTYFDPIAAFHLSDRLVQPGRTLSVELTWRP
ncbi:MAG: TonB-dependent receptor plug domain-containing protein [Woeseiaceae bacterium]